MFHLKDMDSSRKSYSSFSETYVFFSVQIQQKKQLSNFRNAFESRCFKNSSLTIIWNNLCLSYRMYEKES